MVSSELGGNTMSHTHYIPATNRQYASKRTLFYSLLATFMLVLSLLTPSLALAQSDALSGTYQAQSAHLIKKVSVTETGMELEIDAEQLAKQGQAFQTLVTVNQRALAKKIKPGMTSQEIEKTRQELGLDVAAYQKALGQEVEPDKMVEVLENQVSGLYAHVRETGTIYLRLTKPELSQSEGTIRVRLLGEEVLTLTEVSDQGFKLDQVSFVKE